MIQLTIPVNDQDHTQGPRDAAIVLVEYCDYESAFCQQAHGGVKRLQQQLGSHLRFVFRNFPLTTIHPYAEHAAECAEAAGAQGQFWAVHDYLYEHPLSQGNGHLSAFVHSLGLDADRFEREVAEHTHAARVRADFEGGAASGVNGTPTFFVNGLRHDGGYDSESLLAATSAGA